jgi:hypothetical protein
MLNRISISTHSQLPLIHVVNKDDELLSNNCDTQWYSILKNFPWENYRELGASYYNALYDFNISKQLKEEDPKENKETKDEGRQRLLFNRTTMDKSKSALHEMNPKQIAVPLVSPQSVSQAVQVLRLDEHCDPIYFQRNRYSRFYMVPDVCQIYLSFPIGGQPIKWSLQLCTAWVCESASCAASV